MTYITNITSGGEFQIGYVFYNEQIYSYYATCLVFNGGYFYLGKSDIKTIEIKSFVSDTTTSTAPPTTLINPMSSWNCSKMLVSCLSGNLKLCSMCPYYISMGSWFFVIILLGTESLIYFKTQQIAVPLMINFLVAGTLFAYFPIEMWGAQLLASFLAFTGIAYMLYKG
jgi:hypothetical protein